ncbi:MAG TPA: histidinol-phosphate transaminase [Terriglobales bacterium]|nr:histidinol-phosphate transaminase [Terriglobales bacterium]
MLKARTAVQSLKSYHPPLGGRQGLRLDFNENTVGCSPRVLERLRKLTGEELARYPEREPVEALMAKHLELQPGEVLLTNGTDEAIHLVCESYLEPGDEALIAVPTFAMYEIYAAATGAKVIAVPAGEDFQFPSGSILAAISERTRFIAVASPNNPTGTLAPQHHLLRIAQAAPHAALLVDEAYFEFCGATLMTRWRDVPNLFVSRTFSKAHGLAGLRIGVLAGNTEQMGILRRASSPYNLNSVALACLPEALADRQYVSSYVAAVLQGRDRLERELRLRGIKFWPSHANFVLLRLGGLNAAFIAGMRLRGILVRDRSSDPGCEGCVRITLGSAPDNDRLFAALNEVFEQMGLGEKVAQ